MNPENIPNWLLWPLTLPYGAATRLRVWLYRTGILRQKRMPSTVISVGNLTVGGTGKTPMALWIAERLAAENKRAAILMRGYKGDSSAAGADSDEAQLLRARLGDRAEVGVGADRFARGRELQKRGIDWFVLDDGFQHLQLARDVDIVLVDAMDPFGGRLLPAGRRREAKSELRRGDAIVITRSAHAPAAEAAIRRYSNAPIFYARTELASIRKLSAGQSQASDEIAEAADLRTRKFFAFCGVGNPAAFLADLDRWKVQIAGHKFFRDHHKYEQTDVDALVKEARAAGADALVCTEKDAFNLAGVSMCAMEAFYCVISLCVDREDDFRRLLMATANRKKEERRKDSA
ncbi:MAG: tetraacyldisaccharide 4'-kinase [Acidobacteriota bacterium]|nr:tetraacyldisaccharide 4'-kinase [Acidobacteriota bacterium]